MTEWYEESFGEDYLLVYKHRDVQGAEHEVHDMINWLRLKLGSKVLDLCCGMGRHSLALAEAGFRVTGIDLSEVLLREARRMDPGQRVRWVQADMRNLPQENDYDAVVNLFTSFGYFREDAEQLKVLREIRRVLKPGGSYIIDFLNPAYVKRHLVAQSEREDEGQRIQEERSIRDGYVHKHIRITDVETGRDPRNYEERVKLYTRDEMLDLLAQAGLEVDQVHGGYDEEIYDATSSPRMIFVGHRPEE